MTVERLVVVGGDAAGMSAASAAKRLRGDDLEVVVLERGYRTSYSACGIPYWIAGDVGSADDLVARSPAEHRERGIDVRTGHEAVGVDLDAGAVQVRGPRGGASRLSYDQLVMATGATPVRPPLPGAGAEGIHGVQTLEQGEALLAALESERPARAVVVGGGYIGLEMAEACVRRGLTVTLVDAAEEVMRTLDADLGAQVHAAMEGLDIEVRTGVPVEGFGVSGGRVRSVRAGGEELPADLVVLGMGVRPQTEVAAEAGLVLGASGGIRTDAAMRCEGQDAVWAAGDCVESWHRVSQRWVHLPLGTHANKQGRVVGQGVGGLRSRFAGVLGTAITKVCDLEIARTGLSAAEADAAGFDAVAATVQTTTIAGYLPQARSMTVRMYADRRDRRLLGAQIVGGEGSAKRIDTVAVALWNRMTVDEVVDTDLSYAPPYSSVWDPVQVAARAVVSALP